MNGINNGKTENGKLISKRSIFPWGFTNTFMVSSAINETLLNAITDTFLKSTYIHELQSQRELRNLRGRDDGEILHVAGQFLVEQDEDDLPVDNSFSIDLISKYKSSNTIEVWHFLKEIRNGDFPKEVGLRHIPFQIPAQISELRFSLVKYSPRKVSGYLGLYPYTSGHIFLNCTSSTLEIEIQEEGLVSKNQMPWQGHAASVAIMDTFQILERS